jgi:hypothetical protein
MTSEVAVVLGNLVAAGRAAFPKPFSQKVALLRQGFGGPGQAGSAFAFDRGIPVSLRAALRPWRKKILGIGYSIF